MILTAILTTTAQAAPLDVIVTGIRNDRGDIRVAICPQSQFLQETCQNVARTPARSGEVHLRLEIPPGTWAAQAFHDENRNGKIDRNFLGIPTEGLGFSNDPPFRFGPPSFADAAFQLPPTGGPQVAQIRFTLRYF